MLGEYNRAIRRFEAVAQTAPEKSELHLHALYGLGTTWNLRRPGEDPDKAREYYRQIIALAPQSDLAAWALLALARMKHLVPVGQEPDYAEVRRAYEEVMDRYPGHLAAEEAFLYWAATYLATLRPDDTERALARLQEFVRDRSHKFIGPAYSLMAVGYQNLGCGEERLRAELASLETTEVDPANPFTEFAWQYWNIATIAEFEVGDLETARTYYQKLIEEYPTDIRVYACRRALERIEELERRLRQELDAGRAGPS